MNNESLLHPGTPAPDVPLRDSGGAAVSLAHFWGVQPLLIFFMRHFGCAACRQHLFDIRSAYPQLQERGATVVLVTANDPDLATRYAANYHLPFPILSDVGRAAYQAFGVVEGSYWETIGPPALFAQAKLALQGNVPSLPKSIAETKQLSGTYIVNTDGIVQFAHLASPSYNYPATDVYLDIVSQIGQHAR